MYASVRRFRLWLPKAYSIFTQASLDCELSRVVPVHTDSSSGFRVGDSQVGFSLSYSRLGCRINIYIYTTIRGRGERLGISSLYCQSDSEYYSMSSRRLSSRRQGQPVGDFCCRQARKQRVFSRLALSCFPSLPLRTSCGPSRCVAWTSARPPHPGHRQERVTVRRSATAAPGHWSSPLLTASRQSSSREAPSFFLFFPSPPSGAGHNLSKGIRWATQQLTRGRGRLIL